MAEQTTHRSFYKHLPFLFLPLVITFYERAILKPFVGFFDLPDSSQYLLRISTSTAIILLLAIFLGKSYGLEITKKLRGIIGGLFFALVGIYYFFLFVLKIRGFFTPFVAVNLFNWMFGVLREEFVLRGFIQTEASAAFKGKLFGISHSIWLTTVVFSLWHLVNLTIWPWQTVAVQMMTCIPSGIIYGLIKEKTGNTLITYLLHIGSDLLFFAIYTLIFGKMFFQLF